MIAMCDVSRMMRYFSRVLVICTILGTLLAGCQKEVRTSTPTQSTSSPTVFTESTNRPAIDPDMPYFAWEEFETIEPGKSTILDVYTATGVYTTVVTRSYGGCSEYPMENGKYIRIRYGMDYVVESIEIADEPDMPNDPHNAIGFDNYESYTTFLKNADDEKALSGLRTSKEIKSYIQDIREKRVPLMLPYHKGEPIVLEKDMSYTPIPSTIFIGYSLFSGTHFVTQIDKNETVIYVYPLSAEDAEATKDMSCPELIAALKPIVSDVDRYNAQLYTAVFEDTAVIAGQTRSMLVRQKDDYEENFFVLDGCIIKFYAPIGTVTKEWLQEFALVAA